MYAIVESGNITQTFNNPRKLVINDIRYSTNLLGLLNVWVILPLSTIAYI